MNVWLTLHLIGVVLTVGNIVTAAFWKIRADWTNNPTDIHRAVKNVMLADKVHNGYKLIALNIQPLASN